MVKGKCSICKSLCKNKLLFCSLTLKFLFDVTGKLSVVSPAVIFHGSQFKKKKMAEGGEEGWEFVPLKVNFTV